MNIAVTGAFGYSGKAIAEQLLARGDRVRTLTNSPNRPHAFGSRVEVAPLAFDDPAALARSLDGFDVLINTYWVRFDHRLFTFEQAVHNTQALFTAAKNAGVGRIVHTSILKPEQGEGLGYYEGKLRLEHDLAATGLPYTILRPGVLFGRGDILVNNIAWVLRHLPVFGVFGDGRYALAPLHVDDFARIAVRAAGGGDPALPTIVDCHGPETFEYRQLVQRISAIIGIHRPIVRVWPWLGLLISKTLNPFVHDVIITREEIEGLMRGLLWSSAPSLGTTKLTQWMAEHRDSLGHRYASEVGRRVERTVAYENI
jgi:NADH dehydrogenase